MAYRTFNGQQKGKQITNKKKNSKRTTLNIVTYNVRSLPTTERLLELENELKYLNWDIVGVCEVQRRGEKQTTLSSGHVFYHNNAINSDGGIGFLIHKKHTKNVENIKNISRKPNYFTKHSLQTKNNPGLCTNYRL